MYLREVSVGVFRPDYERVFYLREAEHIGLIFVGSLPAKYTLDGTGKTNITLGRKPNEPRYRRLIDVNSYQFDEFDFVAYDAASAEVKDELILAAVETSLLDIAAQHGAELEPIRAAAAAVRSCGFERKTYTKLSRFTRSRKLQLKVFARCSRRGIEWGIDIATPQSHILESRTITPKIDAWRSAHNYRKSRWVGDRFEILDFLGKPTFSFDATGLESRLIS